MRMVSNIFNVCNKHNASFSQFMCIDCIDTYVRICKSKITALHVSPTNDLIKNFYNHTITTLL